MVPIFKVRKLEAREFRLAWPLVNMAHPGLTLPRWLAFARRVHSGNRSAGMTAIEDQRGLIHALAVHRVAEDVQKGRVLVVEPIICARLPGRDLDDVLAEGLKDLAMALHCSGVMVETPLASDAVKDTAQALIARGFVPYALATYASVASPPPIAR